jgi:hypothetical protein
MTQVRWAGGSWATDRPPRKEYTDGGVSARGANVEWPWPTKMLGENEERALDLTVVKLDSVR